MNHGFELRTVNVFVSSVGIVVAAGKIDGGYPKFRSDKGDVGEGALRGLEAFAGDVSREVGIVTAVENGVIFSFAVKFDDEFEVVDFFRQLVLSVSKAELFSPKPADFLVTAEQKPWLDFGTAVDFDESKDAATIVAANALRAHDDVAVRGKAKVANGFFVNGIQMRDKHDGSLPVDENEISLAEQSVAFEFFGEAFEKLLLSRAEEVFQIFHADTSSARQLG